MALTEEGTGMVMPVAPAYANGNSGFGFGGDWAWILLLLVLFGGNWGNGFGGGYGMDGLYPWMNNSQNINGGFRDQMLNSSISGLQNSVTSGFGDVQNALCSGFAGTTAAITGAQNAIASQMYANQLADLERSFAAQTATTQGMTALQSQFSQCCCDNRAGLESVKYAIATENCADRTAVSDALRDVLSANAASTQKILDQLCQDKIDAKNDEIAQLRSQITALNLAASQGAQTAAILANNEAQTSALERYLAPTPIPAYVVANPNCCSSFSGCGCGA